MKRSILCIGTAVLSACSQTGTTFEALPSSQVMKNAAQASVLLESVRYSIDATFDTISTLGMQVQGAIAMNGIMHNSGEHLQANIQLDADVVQQNETTTIQANADFVVRGSQEVYMRLQNYTVAGPEAFFPQVLTDAMKDTWLAVSTPEDQPTSVTPSPRLLYAQAQIVSITEEYTPALLQDRMHYHYKAAVDPEKLIAYILQLSQENGEIVNEADLRKTYESVQIHGEIWIDAQTYHVGKIIWNIEPISLETGRELQAKITASFSDFNNQEPILVPEQTMTLEQLFFLQAVNDTTLSTDVYDLPPSQDEIIESLLLPST